MLRALRPAGGCSFIGKVSVVSLVLRAGQRQSLGECANRGFLGVCGKLPQLGLPQCHRAGYNRGRALADAPEPTFGGVYHGSC